MIYCYLEMSLYDTANVPPTYTDQSELIWLPEMEYNVEACTALISLSDRFEHDNFYK